MKNKQFTNPKDLMKTSTITYARIVNNDKVLEDAKKALHTNLLMFKQELAVIETPQGYIVVDNEGGHKKFIFEGDEQITLIVYNSLTGLPFAKCPATIKQLLTYTDRNQPIAEFISNQDSNEKAWVELIVTMTMGGVNTQKDEEMRITLNNRKIILGGTNPFYRDK